MGTIHVRTFPNSLLKHSVLVVADEPCHTYAQSLKLHTIASQINIMFINSGKEQVTHLGQTLPKWHTFENRHSKLTLAELHTTPPSSAKPTINATSKTLPTKETKKQPSIPAHYATLDRSTASHPS
jgi:hypothetical protein